MRRIVNAIARSTSVLLGLLCLPGGGWAQTNAASETVLCVATYNVRYASPEGPHAWERRRPLIRQLLHAIEPDVLGTQEGLHSQLKDIAEDLPDHEWIGLGREGGSRGEFMAVFYRKDRLDPLEFDHFWLSETPATVGSTSWGNALPRMVTWIRFRDRRSGLEFYFFNTHFDHQSARARERSAALIRDRVAALPPGSSVLLVGDFNCAAGPSRPFTLLTDDGFFRDTWNEARIRHGEGLGTFNAFRSIPKNEPRIDWILARGPVTVDSAEIVSSTPQGLWPSDHFPVVAKLRLVQGANSFK